MNDVVEQREVSVLGDVQTGVEVAAGDGLRGACRVGERTHGAAARPDTKERAEQRRADRGADEDEADRAQRVLQLRERDDLEVARVHVDERHPDGEHCVAPQRVAHAGRAARGDALAQLGGERVTSVLEREREPAIPEQHQGEGPCRRLK